MDVFNLFAEQEWEHENDRAGYRHRVTRVGARLGAHQLGGSLYELPPGERTWPYHYEIGCEEWLLVVDGRPTLRSPAGEQDLAPGDVVVFPEGPEGAHQVVNRSDTACRLLILSTKPPVAVVHYPDSRKVGIWHDGQPDGPDILAAEPRLGYWHDEP